MRRLLSTFAVLSIIAASAVLTAGLSPAGAACAPSTDRQISGTVQGEDGRYVSSQIGIELFDSAGRKLYMDGCVMTVGGYSTNAHTNVKPAAPGNPLCCYILPGEGSVASTYNGYTLSKEWSMGGLPANAVTAWIEIYPKRAGGQPNTDDVRYGRALRRPIALPAGNVAVRLPLRCGLSGNGVVGSTGSIQGRAYDNGAVVAHSRVGAWSQEHDTGTKILGWSLDGPRPGLFDVEPLAPGTYSVIVTANGFSKQVFGVQVAPCRATYIDVAVRGAVPGAASPNDRPVVGDWDGDGDDEPGTFTPGGTWKLRAASEASAPTTRTFTYGSTAGDVPVVGDWDGDGIDDVGVFRTGGVWYLRSSITGQTLRTFTYGQAAGDVPVVGDWDGDGIDDAGLYRAGGVWYLRSSITGQTLRTFTFGVGSNDRPVVGDWNGDNDDEPGIFRAGTWYLRTTSGTSAAQLPAFRFGIDPADVPLAGDWTGDRTDAPGVYRRGTWILRSGTATTATLTSFTFQR